MPLYCPILSAGEVWYYPSADSWCLVQDKCSEQAQTFHAADHLCSLCLLPVPAPRTKEKREAALARRTREQHPSRPSLHRGSRAMACGSTHISLSSPSCFGTPFLGPCSGRPESCMAFKSRNAGFAFDKNHVPGYQNDAGFRGEKFFRHRSASNKMRLVSYLRVGDGLA